MRNGSKSFAPSCPVEERPPWMRAYMETLCGALHPIPEPGKEMDHATFAYSMVFFHGWNEREKRIIAVD